MKTIKAENVNPIQEVNAGSTMLAELKDIAHELDCELSAVGERVSVLSDVKESLKTLSQDVDDHAYNADTKGINEHRIILDGIRRDIKILSELMAYTVHELEKDYVSTQGISESIFDKVARKK